MTRLLPLFIAALLGLHCGAKGAPRPPSRSVDHPTPPPQAQVPDSDDDRTSDDDVSDDSPDEETP